MHASTSEGKQTESARCIVAENVTGGWHSIVFRGDPRDSSLSVIHRSNKSAETAEKAIAQIPTIFKIDRHRITAYRWTPHMESMFSLADAMAGIRVGVK